MNELLRSDLDQKFIDEKWMRRALLLAAKAEAQGEVPVGALLVAPDGKTLLAQSYNHRETWQSPLAHAEAIVLHTASKKIQNWRLENCTLYVTLEPCLMCAGALLQSRVHRVVYGTKDPKGGAVESLYRTFEDTRLNHQIEVSSGVLEHECAELLRNFFKSRRDEHKSERAQKTYRQRASVVVLHDNQILGFHAVDPYNQKKYFFLPGGEIEPGESPELAATRETAEETGYKIRLLPELQLRRRYSFEWNGQIRPCETVFFVGVLDQPWKEPGVVADAAYNRGPDWVPVNQTNKIFSYHKDILWAVNWAIKKVRRPRGVKA